MKFIIGLILFLCVGCSNGVDLSSPAKVSMVRSHEPSKNSCIYYFDGVSVSNEKYVIMPCDIAKVGEFMWVENGTLRIGTLKK